MLIHSLVDHLAVLGLSVFVKTHGSFGVGIPLLGDASIFSFSFSPCSCPFAHYFFVLV
jgi:hypothetical protein